jgi:hypothetical protein
MLLMVATVKSCCQSKQQAVRSAQSAGPTGNVFCALVAQGKDGTAMKGSSDRLNTSQLSDPLGSSGSAKRDPSAFDEHRGNRTKTGQTLQVMSALSVVSD